MNNFGRSNVMATRPAALLRVRGTDVDTIHGPIYLTAFEAPSIASRQQSHLTIEAGTALHHRPNGQANTMMDVTGKTRSTGTGSSARPSISLSIRAGNAAAVHRPQVPEADNLREPQRSRT